VILEIARIQVLEDGVGLTKEQAVECLRLPDERVDELLDLAHEVRLAWCGDEVEVEGIVSVKTGGCPEIATSVRSRAFSIRRSDRPGWIFPPSSRRRKRLPP
jgi:hypothetical protein